MARVVFSEAVADRQDRNANWIAVARSDDGRFEIQAGLRKARGVEISYGKNLSLETAVGIALQEAERLNISDVWVQGTPDHAAHGILESVVELENAAIG